MYNEGNELPPHTEEVIDLQGIENAEDFFAKYGEKVRERISRLNTNELLNLLVHVGHYGFNETDELFNATSEEVDFTRHLTGDLNFVKDICSELNMKTDE
ncbi:MAG: hypothetical protein HGA31_06540 [Candidatus Moranbacteria bacterium]|nr:hypothetical protein [Candidatus Moranbacteria bacterium]